MRWSIVVQIKCKHVKTENGRIAEDAQGTMDTHGRTGSNATDDMFFVDCLVYQRDGVKGSRGLDVAKC